ncbi:hypothetical protein ACU8DI_14815 [Psychroserpens sp. BH13MA-6]
MRKRNYIKPIALLFVVASLSYLFYKCYRNYQIDKIIQESNTNIIYSNYDSKFKKFTDSESKWNFNESLLDSISRIKDSITIQFLNITEQRIIFSALDKDTLTIKIDKELNSTYSSSLDKGIYDKKFNDYLFKSLKSFLSEHQIKQIEIYTLTPTEYNNVPPIPGTLANFDYEKEFRDNY